MQIYVPFLQLWHSMKLIWFKILVLSEENTPNVKSLYRVMDICNRNSEK